MTRTAISPRLAIKIFFGTNTYLFVAVSPTNPSSQPNWPVGWTVHHVAETGSTNDDLFAAARNGAAHRSVVVADFQTAGRGRLDRTWEAVRGANLLVSLLFRYETDTSARFPRIVALAARAACLAYADVAVSLKWPNDLQISDEKCGGLLAVASPRDRFVVVGIGVNVGWAPVGASALSRHSSNESLRPLELLSVMLCEIDRRVGRTDHELSEEHRAALSTLGRRVRVEMHDGEIIGEACDVDDLARLVVRDDSGREQVIDVGDVVHLRDEDSQYRRR